MAAVTIKRPVIISILLVMSYVFLVLFSMGMLLSPETKRMGDFYPALFGLLVAIRFVALTGIWYMKRWGVELFIITFGATVLKGILLNDFSIVSTLWHLVLIVLCGIFYTRMDKNL